MRRSRTVAGGGVLLLAALGVCTAGRADEPDRRDAGRAMILRGRIARIQPSEHEVTVRTREGREVRVFVGERSRLSLEDRPATLDSFREGDRVRVVYEVVNGQTRVVSMMRGFLAGVVRRGLQEFTEGGRGLAFEKREEYRRRLERALRDVDDEIDGLKDQIADAGHRSRRQFADDLEALRKRREAVRDQLDRVRAAREGDWDDIKAGVDTALGDLQKALDRVRSRVR